MLPRKTRGPISQVEPTRNRPTLGRRCRPGVGDGMSVNVSGDSKQMILLEACARNQPIEVHYTDKRNRQSVAKSRLLRLEGDHVLIDRPTAGRHLADVGFDTVVFICYFVQGQRFGFQTRARRVRSFQLNRQTRLIALEIVKPETIVKHQRRADFRVSLVSYPDLYAWFEPVNADTDPDTDTDDRDFGGERPEPAPEEQDDAETNLQAAAAQPGVFKARVANLSAGGIAGIIGITDRSERRINVGDLFWVSFELPGEQRLFRFAAEVRHTIRHRRPAPFFIGCKFLLSDSPFGQSGSLEPLTRFIAREQRRQLRRRKSMPC